MKINWCKIFGHKEIQATFKIDLDNGTSLIANRNFVCKRCSTMDKELSEEDKISLSKWMNKEFNVTIIRFGNIIYNK